MFDVYVDSAANIPAELVDKHGITVLPMKLTLNGKPIASFEPGLTPEQERQKGHEFYQAMREGARPQTSLVNTGEFTDAMRESLATTFSGTGSSVAQYRDIGRLKGMTFQYTGQYEGSQQHDPLC